MAGCNPVQSPSCVFVFVFFFVFLFVITWQYSDGQVPAYPKPILAEAQNYLTQEQSAQGPDKAAISQFQIAMFKLIIIKQSFQKMQDISTSSRNWVSQEFFGGAQITVAVLGELSSLRHLAGASTPTSVDVIIIIDLVLINVIIIINFLL